VCRILAARRDKTGFVRESQRGFLVLLRSLPEKRGSTSDSSRYALTAPDPRMGFAVGTAILHRAVDPQGRDRRNDGTVNGFWMDQIWRNLTDSMDGILTGSIT